jgi:two-component system, LytTR family, response regulator
MYKCIVIEDEPLDMERTKGFIEKIPFLYLCATFDNAMDGLAYLKSNTIEILFLDINMDEVSGIELLQNTKINSHIIITTAYEQYALKGYELNISDYLLKPFSFSRFLSAVNNIIEKINEKQNKKVIEYIFIKTENRLEKVNLSDILYIEGMSDYRKIHTTSKRIMTLQSFNDLENIIPSSIICRVHKSYMVAINKIETIERRRIKINSTLIPISDTYKDFFFKYIK